MNPIAVSLGNPSGIGPEVIAKAWELRADHGLKPFFGVGDVRSISAIWNGPVAQDQRAGNLAGLFFVCAPDDAVQQDADEIVPGQPNVQGARRALHSLELAVGLARSSTAGALVTRP